jgi:hypothetical protein
VRLLEENIGEILQDIGMDKEFWGKTKYREKKPKIDKWEYIN